MSKISVIYGSSREGGTGDRVLNHFKNIAKETENEKTNFLTVKDYNLPFFKGEPPLMVPNRELSGSPEKWINDINESDGYLIITPEYDRSIPGVLKNGIDYIGYEIKGKPVKIVSYSINMAGGARAATAMVDILHTLGAIVLPTDTSLGKAQEWLNKDGSFNKDSEGYKYNKDTAKQAFNEIIYYTRLLKNNPYKR